MKSIGKKTISRDDNLFGLLSSYKPNCTYLKVLESKEDGAIIVQMTDNPRNWAKIVDEKFKKFRELRRIEIGVLKLSIKYLTPEHLIGVIGPLLEMHLPAEVVEIRNRIREEGYFILETSLKFKAEILQGVRKIIGLNPQKKYEILEKSLQNQE